MYSKKYSLYLYLTFAKAWQTGSLVPVGAVAVKAAVGVGASRVSVAIVQFFV